jgi:hypothetical protein
MTRVEGLLGSAAVTDTDTKSTPVIEKVYKVGRWSARPTAYVVVSRTAKTMKAVEVENRNGYRTQYQNLVRSSDIGHDWFLSERDAWLSILTRCQRQVEADKAALQRSRTDLGMVRATLAREGIDVAQDGEQPEAAQPSKHGEAL